MCIMVLSKIQIRVKVHVRIAIFITRHCADSLSYYPLSLRKDRLAHPTF